MIEARGGPEALRLVEHELRERDTDEVTLLVEYAGVSFVDLLMTRGLYQYRPPLPFVPGIEVCGVVEDPGSSSHQQGDRVVAYVRSGGYGQRVHAPSHLVYRLPSGFTAAEGAGSIVNLHTAMFGLENRAQLRHGETVVVHGAGGGLGQAFVCIAAALGAEVTAICSSQEKMRAAEGAGAARTVRTSEWPGWADQHRRQIDVVVDIVGEPVFDASLRVLRPGGRYLTAGYASGQIPAVALNRLLLSNVSVAGVAWGAAVESNPVLAARLGNSIERLAALGRLQPSVETVYPFEEAPAALRSLESRRTVGKSVLKVR